MSLRVGLTHTQMKLGRASQHLDQLQREISDFIQSDPFIETRYDDVRRAKHIISVEQKQTPDLLGILVGDFAYCIRSGLDHLAWQLALLTTDKPNRETAFPIESEAPRPGNKSISKKTACIPQQAIKVMEELQPYHRGSAFKDHPLWQINRLCNFDKHQLVAVSSIQFKFGIFGVSEYLRSDSDNITEIAINLSEKSQVEFEAKVIRVLFGDPIDKTDAVANFEITIDGLRKIYKFVRYDAVPRFACFFR